MRIVSMLFVLFMLSVNSYGFERYTAHGGPIKGLAYSADLGLMVSTSFDYTAVIWDAGTMQELATHWTRRRSQCSSIFA